jgi:hypothetical protein
VGEQKRALAQSTLRFWEQIEVSPIEPTLPGMGQVPAERAEATAEQQRKDLTEKLTEPPKSIERAAGEMEQKSPLFRDTEANPQSGLFGGLISGESGEFDPKALAKAVSAVYQQDLAPGAGTCRHRPA